MEAASTDSPRLLPPTYHSWLCPQVPQLCCLKAQAMVSVCYYRLIFVDCADLSSDQLSV